MGMMMRVIRRTQGMSWICLLYTSSWWLYDAAPDYEVWTDDEKTKWCLKEPEALYDFIRDECQG